MDIETATIHQVIDGIPREEEVPPETVESWAAHGWIPGPFPRDVDADNRPPKAGKGSGFDAWLDYAASRDIVLEVGASRLDIIAAVEALDPPPVDVAISDTETSPVGEIPTAPEEDQS